MATIRVRSSHISGRGPPILGSGLGPLGSDQGMRKTAGNLAVVQKSMRVALTRKKTHEEIQGKDASAPASFLTRSV